MGRSEHSDQIALALQGDGGSERVSGSQAM